MKIEAVVEAASWGQGRPRGLALGLLILIAVDCRRFVSLSVEKVREVVPKINSLGICVRKIAERVGEPQISRASASEQQGHATEGIPDQA